VPSARSARASAAGASTVGGVRGTVNFLVWIMMGIAIWHFAVFAPDHFWGGIVGALGFAILGAVALGLALAGGEVDNASLKTALEAVPGAVLGLAASYFIGRRREDPRLSHMR
jgi:hypothetical protein